MSIMGVLFDAFGGSVLLAGDRLVSSSLSATMPRSLTSFVTLEGVYRLRSLPFGLASGPSTFHQVVCKILDGLEGCVSILD